MYWSIKFINKKGSNIKVSQLRITRNNYLNKENLIMYLFAPNPFIFQVYRKKMPRKNKN